MNCYFDTSIYNNILDDPQKDLIIEEINKRGMTTLPSIVNLCEILSTNDEERKKNLLGIYHKIRNEYHALKQFTVLLRDATLAIQQNKSEIEVNSPLDIFINVERLCKKLKSRAGKEFEKYISKARDEHENMPNEKKIHDAKTIFKIYDDKKNQPHLIDFFILWCKSLGIQNLKLKGDEIISIIKSNATPWKYYIESHTYILYKKGLCSEGFGRKSNPGDYDLEQCIYLFWADIFVIQDGNFYDFLDELNGLRGYNKKIFTYDEFKKDLGL